MKCHFLGEDLEINQVGGKAYNLSVMLKAGISVPNGFVLFDSPKEITNKEIADLIRSYLLKLNSPFVMVRSSAVGEDGGDTSFAGQLDSFKSLNNLDDVVDYIQKCFASLNNLRSSIYSSHFGDKLVKMGVVVQEMIEPDYAGVLFTHSPSNYNELYLEWVEGHAEKLVSGQVTPSSISYSLQNLPKTAPFDLKKLSILANKIFELYERPQDIEWTVKNNIFYIVQSRPITKISHQFNWSNTNVNENYPDKLTPFQYSLAKTSYYHYFRNLTLMLNLYPKNDNKIENSFNNIIGMWGHRMFYNMSNIHRVFELSPFSTALKKSFDDFVGYQKPILSLDGLNSVVKKIKFVATVIIEFIKQEKRVRYIENLVDSYYKVSSKAFDLKTYSESYHSFLDIRFNQWKFASFSDFFAMCTHGLLGKVCERIDKTNAHGIQNKLLQTIPNLISNKPIYELYEMHLLILKSENLKKLFSESSGEVIWQSLLKNKDDVESLDLFKYILKYLENWGFRCSGELVFLTPNYIENPPALMELLKTYHKSQPEEPKVYFAQKIKEQKTLINDIQKKTWISRDFFWLPFILKPLVRLTTYSISCRERVRLKQAKLYYGVKIVIKKIAEILVKKKIINNESDIYFLEYLEISELLSGEEVFSSYFVDLVEIRKKKFEQAKDPKDNFHSIYGEFTNEIITPALNSSEGLRGLPACGGEITGTICVLESMHDIGQLTKGDILVTRQTDPGWICAFPLISGLIVERGGMLSHGAIVAREFGIPAIVGVDNVMNILKTGQKVTINAYSGVILCHD